MRKTLNHLFTFQSIVLLVTFDQNVFRKSQFMVNRVGTRNKQNFSVSFPVKCHCMLLILPQSILAHWPYWKLYLSINTVADLFLLLLLIAIFFHSLNLLYYHFKKEKSANVKIHIYQTLLWKYLYTNQNIYYSWLYILINYKWG